MKFFTSAVIAFFIYILSATNSFSQGVAINTAGAAADASAILDVSSVNSGILIPRMTKTQKAAINQPAEGLLIYQTDDTTGFWFYNGNAWKQLGADAGNGLTSGSYIGNTLYWNGNNWVESSNIFNAGGSVGIGTNNPDITAKVEINSANSGLLIPRMTTTERNSISNPAEGLQILNITNRCLEIYFSPEWQTVYCNCPSPLAPNAASHISGATQITWNWNSVSNAVGYKYNSINDYSTATDNGLNTSYTQGGLTCETNYNLYVWAYNNCSVSSETLLNSTTLICCPSSFVDNRDGKTYQAVLIGNQCWMAQNLNYGTFVNLTNNGQAGAGTQKYCSNSSANNDPSCPYGGLYEWNEMMNGSASCNGTGASQPQCNTPVQGICPTGWHIPSHYEWTLLEKNAGSSPNDFPYDITTTGWRGTDEGNSMRATTGWNVNNGTNNIGFNALPGGFSGDDGSGFYMLNNTSWWHSSTEATSTWSWYRQLNSNENRVNRYYDFYSTKEIGMSVRCVKD